MLVHFTQEILFQGGLGRAVPLVGQGRPKGHAETLQRGLLHPFHFHHESITLCLPHLGLRRRRAYPSSLILNASLHSTSSSSILPQSQTFLVPSNNLDLCSSQHSAFFSLSLQSPSLLPPLLFKTPLKFNTNLKMLKLVENKATLFPCSYEPHSDWKPPPGLT